MIVLDYKNVRNSRTVTLAKDGNLFVIYVHNVRVYFSIVYEHAKAFYTKIVEMNGGEV